MAASACASTGGDSSGGEEGGRTRTNLPRATCTHATIALPLLQDCLSSAQVFSWRECATAAESENKTLQVYAPVPAIAACFSSVTSFRLDVPQPLEQLGHLGLRVKIVRPFVSHAVSEVAVPEHRRNTKSSRGFDERGREKKKKRPRNLAQTRYLVGVQAHELTSLTRRSE